MYKNLKYTLLGLLIILPVQYSNAQESVPNSSSMINCPELKLASNQRELIKAIEKENTSLGSSNDKKTFSMLGDVKNSIQSISPDGFVARINDLIPIPKFHEKSTKDSVDARNMDAQFIRQHGGLPLFYINVRTLFGFELERRHPPTSECWAEFTYRDNSDPIQVTRFPLAIANIILKAKKISTSKIQTREFLTSKTICPSGVTPKTPLPNDFYPQLFSARKPGAEKTDLNEGGFIIDHRKPQAQRYLITQALLEMQKDKVSKSGSFGDAFEDWGGFFFDSAGPLTPYLLDVYGIDYSIQSGLPTSLEDFTSKWASGVSKLLSQQPSGAFPKYPESVVTATNGRIRILRTVKGKLRQGITYDQISQAKNFVEGFCFEQKLAANQKVSWEPKSRKLLLDDLWVMNKVIKDFDSEILEKTNGLFCPLESTDASKPIIPGSSFGEIRSTVRRLQTFCLSTFLLEYQPEKAFFSFGNGYLANKGLGEVESNAPETYFDLGSPLPSKVTFQWPEKVKTNDSFVGLLDSKRSLSFNMIGKTSVALRSFERGDIYVNLDPTVRVIKANRSGFALILSEDSAQNPLGIYQACKVAAGSSLKIPQMESIIIRTDKNWPGFIDSNTSTCPFVVNSRNY